MRLLIILCYLFDSTKKSPTHIQKFIKFVFFQNFFVYVKYKYK